MLAFRSQCRSRGWREINAWFRKSSAICLSASSDSMSLTCHSQQIGYHPTVLTCSSYILVSEWTNIAVFIAALRFKCLCPFTWYCIFSHMVCFLKKQRLIFQVSCFPTAIIQFQTSWVAPVLLTTNHSVKFPFTWLCTIVGLPFPQLSTTRALL